LVSSTVFNFAEPIFFLPQVLVLSRKFDQMIFRLKHSNVNGLFTDC
jgi:hypothetical protein